MKSTIHQLYRYVIRNKKIKDSKTIILDLTTLYMVSNCDDLYYVKKNVVQKQDEILFCVEELSDFLFLQENMKEQEYIDIYNSLQLIYHIRKEEVNQMKQNIICVDMLLSCFTRLYG
jgi:hypothetical protein